RRIYQYDAGQGWEVFNMLSSIGAYMLVVATSIFVFNFFKSRRSGPIAGNDPWGAPTLEWSIPSPVPEYNFAKLPTVTSRYPMWDLKSPLLSEEEASGAEHRSREGVAAHVETETFTAAQL